MEKQERNPTTSTTARILVICLENFVRQTVTVKYNCVQQCTEHRLHLSKSRQERKKTVQVWRYDQKMPYTGLVVEPTTEVEEDTRRVLSGMGEGEVAGRTC